MSHSIYTVRSPLSLLNSMQHGAVGQRMEEHANRESHTNSEDASQSETHQAGNMSPTSSRSTPNPPVASHSSSSPNQQISSTANPQKSYPPQIRKKFTHANHNLHPLEPLLKIMELLTSVFSFCSLSDLNNVSLTCKNFLWMVRNSVPLSVAFSDTITEKQLDLLKSSCFMAVSIRYKLNHPLSEEELSAFQNNQPSLGHRVPHPDGDATVVSTRDYQCLQNICDALVDMIKRNHRLETIMLTNLHFHTRGMIDIMEELEKKKSLKRISVGAFKYEASLPHPVLQSLCQLLRNNHSITELGLKALNPNSDHAVYEVLQALQFTPVEQLSLHRDPITVRVGQSIVSLIQKCTLKAFRLLVFPGQSIDGCSKIFDALTKYDTVNRVLFGGCLNRSNTEYQKPFANYLKKSKQLKLLHLIDFSDWSDNLPLLIDALRANTSLSILKIQFASRVPIKCLNLLKKLKDVLIHHPSLVKVTLENALIHPECYQVFADVLKDKRSPLRVIHLLNVAHDKQPNHIMSSLVNIREALMTNDTLQNFKVVPTDQFLSNSNIMILYYQILAVCAKNCAIQKTRRQDKLRGLKQKKVKVGATPSPPNNKRKRDDEDFVPNKQQKSNPS